MNNGTSKKRKCVSNTCKNSSMNTILMSMKMCNPYKDFDISFENNTKIYLTECLTFAQANNARLQEE